MPTFNGGPGDDVYDGTPGQDVVYGNGGNDTLSGGADGDSLYGGDDNDVLDGGTSTSLYDLLNGGNGIDTAAFASSTRPVQVFLSEAGVQQVSAVEAVQLIGIENLIGSVFGDVLAGDDGANVIDGGTGGDEMVGFKGDDIYYVQSPSDEVIEAAGGGTDRVIASVNHILAEWVENLTLVGSGAIAGTGNQLANRIEGTGADNILDGGVGADTLIGHAGNDTYYVDNPGDRLVETEHGGIDTAIASVSYNLAGEYVENLTLAGSANINADGNSLNNLLIGNDGNNLLNGHNGADTMRGGLGDDSYVVDNAADVVIESSQAGTDTVQSYLNYTLGENLENLTLIGSGAINGTGNALANTITGNAAANILDGGAGDDIMMGGAGDDSYYVDNSGDQVIERSASGGNDTVYSSISYTIASKIYVENITLLGNANIDATGNSAVNLLTGNTGNNILDGGKGADTMAGGLGDDTYYVDDPGDKIVSPINSGADQIYASVSYKISDKVYASATLTGNDNLDLTGSSHDDTLFGNSGNNVLNGGAGHDGMVGGLGDDVYYLDSIQDGAVETADGGYDIVYLNPRTPGQYSYRADVYIEEVHLLGISPISLLGNKGDNLLVGNDANNGLSAYSGNDTLDGGLGNDGLSKGSFGSNTTFRFSTTLGPDNIDTIYAAFQNGHDKIALDRSIFTEAGPDGALATDAFYSGSAAHDDSDRIIYDAVSGGVYYDPDGTGGAAQVQFAIVDHAPALNSGDFLILS